VPDEYQQGLSSRKAIYIQLPQAVPSSYLIDMNNCLGNNPIACGKCMDACEKECIDFDMQDEIFNLEIGTILVATGMGVYDPTELDEFGYRGYENVITSMEFERLICAGGPNSPDGISGLMVIVWSERTFRTATYVPSTKRARTSQVPRSPSPIC